MAADTPRRSESSFPWQSAATILLLVSGSLFLIPQLKSSRPSASKETSAAVSDSENETVQARLWEDPLSAAQAAVEATRRLPTTLPGMLHAADALAHQIH